MDTNAEVIAPSQGTVGPELQHPQSDEDFVREDSKSPSTGSEGRRQLMEYRAQQGEAWTL